MTDFRDYLVVKGVWKEKLPDMKIDDRKLQSFHASLIYYLTEELGKEKMKHPKEMADTIMKAIEKDIVNNDV